MHLRRHILPLAAAAALSAAAVATAEPARTITLSASAPAAAWEAGPFDSGGTPVLNPAPSCSPTRPCDDNLLKVDDAGTLVIDVKGTGTEADIDLYLYKSNEAGEPQGEPLAESIEVSPDEKVSKAVPKGLYLARVVVYAGIDVSYKGTAKLNGAAAPAPAPEPGATPTPAPSGSGATPKPGATPLNASVKVGKAKLRTALKSGLPVAVTCNTSCQGLIEVSISARDAKRYKLGKKAVIVAGSKFVPGSGDRTVSVKFAKKAAKRLAKAKKLTLAVNATVTDPQGGQSRSIKLKATLKK